MENFKKNVDDEAPVTSRMAIKQANANANNVSPKDFKPASKAISLPKAPIGAKEKPSGGYRSLYEQRGQQPRDVAYDENGNPIEPGKFTYHEANLQNTKYPPHSWRGTYKNPHEYAEAMRIFSPENKLSPSQQKRYDEEIADEPNKSRLYDLYGKDNFLKAGLDSLLYNEGYQDSDFDGIDDFSGLDRGGDPIRNEALRDRIEKFRKDFEDQLDALNSEY